jgi:acyl-CoA synthetase (AMP-forming)/AMP-acid ligase II
MMHSSGLPFGGAHWADHVARHAFAIPGAVAIRYQGESITWAGLHDRVRRAAAAFAGQGVRRGDRIAVLMTNRPEFLESVLAASAIGAIAVPVNFRLAPAEAAYILQDSGASLVVTDPPLAPLAEAAVAASQATASQAAQAAQAGPVPVITTGADGTYEGLLAAAPPAPGEVEIDERDIALIMYTSGTTGRPKGAMLSHLNLLMQAITAIRTSRLTDDQSVGMINVPRGEVGEIVYRGPSLMAGYWNNPAATEEAFSGGWFHSGDLVREDEEGFLYVVDRKKDMIISGGENIYCAEVENVLSGHPAVADVAVIGARHEKWGETPVAVVVPADPAAPPTLEDLTGWTAGRLASYKKPTGLVVLDELPRNASGKVLKHELRARYGGS